MELKLTPPEEGIDADSVEVDDTSHVITVTPIFYKKRTNIAATGPRVTTYDADGNLLFAGHLEVDGRTGAVTVEKSTKQRVDAPADTGDETDGEDGEETEETEEEEE